MARSICILAAALAAPAPVLAQTDGNFALGLGGGTVGGSLEAQYRFNDQVTVRATGNVLSISEEADVDDITYEGDLEFSGAGGFIDYHPFSNSFFISGGAYFGDKSIGLAAEPNEPVTIGDTTFTPDQVGRLEGDASFDDLAPFLGLGYDNTFTGDGHWGFRIMAGAALFGAADVDLRSVGGTFSDDPALLAEIEEEEARIEDDVEDFQLYPILTLGLNYRF
ncbi:MAG: hypothetical protein MRY64_10400 [Hyphomonadaceae bacterium]|nr:hypothetical protein [Hyphomonadaceae bacterium]